jgi:amino acid transporter
MTRQDLGPIVRDPRTKEVQRLRPNAVGMSSVMFMAIATAAPIAAMVGNVPISVGFGNGAYTPASYLVATVVLSLFALGYSAMARHITATGAFYGFISFGLGRVVGMAAGALTTIAYVVFEAAVIGLFSFFADNFFAHYLGVDLPWIWFALFMLAFNAAASYYKIKMAASILGVFLVSEIVMLTLMTIAIVFAGGGPEGWSLNLLNPLGAFRDLNETVPSVTEPGATLAVAGAAGVGLFFAFWSWVGFESAAMYGEESRNPQKIIPRATMISVMGIGIFYVIVSWAAIMGTGPQRAIALAQDPATAGQIFFGPVEEHLGVWAVGLFEFLMVMSAFACAMAFHGCASRYIYAIGREDSSTLLGRTVGATHWKHGSPYVAGFTQSAIATVIVLWFFFTGRDPYLQLFALLGLMGTTALVIVQILASVACIAYFHIGDNRPSDAHWFRTFVAPLTGGLGLLYFVYLLNQNASFAAGSYADDVVFKMIPWVVGITGLGGIAFALAVRRFSPRRYEMLGRVVLDVRERGGLDTDELPVVRHGNQHHRR